MAKTAPIQPSVLDRKALRMLARPRLADAQALYRARRYHAATYLCGYAVEYALKARICRTLKWDDYRIGEKYRSFKVHDLDALLGLSGREAMILKRYDVDWDLVRQWNPES